MMDGIVTVALAMVAVGGIAVLLGHLITMDVQLPGARVMLKMRGKPRARKRSSPPSD